MTDDHSGDAPVNEPEAGPSWAERARLEPLEAVIDPGDKGGGKNRLIDRMHKRALARAVGEIRGAAVLDFGCGTGRIADWLVDKGADVDGVDAASEMVAVARTRVPRARFSSTDGSVLPFPDSSFDLVVSVGVLQYHVGKHGKIPVELARVLRSGGHIVAIEHVTEGDLGRGGPLSAYRDMLVAGGFAEIEVETVRVNDSRVVGAAQQHPWLSRLPGLPWLATVEARRRSKVPPSGERYWDVLFRAAKAG